MSAEDAFLSELAAKRQQEGGSDFRLSLQSVGGSTRALAEELGVSQRTVQRWRNYDEGTGKQSRNPGRSPQAGDLKAMADVQRDQRALDRMAQATEFQAEIEVNYVPDGADEGNRAAYAAVQPLNMAPVVELYRQNAPMADVGAALTAAINQSYLPETSFVGVTDVTELSLQ
jgi:hypothetical protein